MNKLIGYVVALSCIFGGVAFVYLAVFRTSEVTGQSVTSLVVERGFSVGSILSHSPGFFIAGTLMAIVGLVVFLLTRNVKAGNVLKDD